MDSEKRIVLIEKIKPWDYVDNYGNRIWLNKYGDIIKKQNKSGKILTGHNMEYVFTTEMMQDISALHGIDIEAELTAALSRELGQEIDRSILTAILNNPIGA